jgi:uncharacterized membrane protein YcaP (DUF421 family)
MNWATALFGEISHVSVLQECARAVVILAYGLLLVRVAGRRIFGKWAAVDIIVSVIVGSNLSRTLTGNAPMMGTLAATTLLIILHWSLVHLAARSTIVSHMVEGRAVDLSGAHGLDEKARMQHAVSEADLAEALRQSGIERVEDARKMTLEPSGKISVLKKG